MGLMEDALSTAGISSLPLRNTAPPPQVTSFLSGRMTPTQKTSTKPTRSEMMGVVLGAGHNCISLVVLLLPVVSVGPVWPEALLGKRSHEPG